MFALSVLTLLGFQKQPDAIREKDEAVKIERQGLKVPRVTQHVFG